jgi:lysozyme
VISRRVALAGLAGLTGTAMAGCAGRPAATAPGYVAQPVASSTPSGLDAVIDISHNVTVGDFASVRRSKILAVLHKATEGGDWVDPSYAIRRPQAEAAGLLWGAYHLGTRQYSGADQAAIFVSTVRPGKTTLMALDLEPNDANPRNTMTLAQAEAFVLTVQQTTGRLPLVYTHPAWANGQRYGRRGLSLDRPVTPGSILARCDLWLADYREEPQMPWAWADRGWRLWQYAANQTEADGAYGAPSKIVAGVTHCDRNLFAGDESGLYRFWKGRAGAV